MADAADHPLPALADLHKASVGAVLLVAVLAVTIVLPAERGIDPTGVGGLLGLTSLGELKMGTLGDTKVVDPDAPYAERSDTTKLALQPGQSLEMKVKIRGGDALVYTWTATGPLFFDFHGEEKGKPSSAYVSFEKATKSSATGTHEAPFEGTHGWYWKNKGEATVELTLETAGPYIDLKRM